MNKNAKMSPVIATVLVYSVAIIAIIIFNAWFGHVADVNAVEEEEVVYAWACFDGCYNMIEIYFVNVSKPYPDYIKNDFYQPCADKCFKQWVD